MKLKQQENSLSASNSKGQILLIFSQQEFCTGVFANLDLTFSSATVKVNLNTFQFAKQPFFFFLNLWQDIFPLAFVY